MGQYSQCCRLPFLQGKIDINEVRIYWPQVAQQVLQLRQQNKQLNLIIDHNNISQDSKKSKGIIYKQFITSRHYYFGYVNLSQLHFQTEANRKCSLEQQNANKRKFSENKQNEINLSFLNSGISLNDFGILIEKQKACYKGFFKNNKFHGRGFLSVLQIQEKFEGIFQNGFKANGVYENKQIKYTGEFFKNQIKGKGKIQWKNNKNHYDGNVLNSQMNGKGKIVYDNGDSYQGQFQNGIYDGQGTYKWATGQVFKGLYKKGKKHGFGVMTLQGIRHKMCWVNDKAEAKPLNYQQFQTKKQINSRKQLTSKTKQTIKSAQVNCNDRGAMQNDQTISITNPKARTQMLIT